jgi:hypothetical protein
MWPESCNLPICCAGICEARSHGNMKCSITLGLTEVLKTHPWERLLNRQLLTKAYRNGQLGQIREVGTLGNGDPYLVCQANIN